MTKANFTHCGLFQNDGWWHDAYSVELWGIAFEFKRGIGHRKYKNNVSKITDPVHYHTCLSAQWKNPRDPKLKSIYEKYTIAPLDFPVDDLLYSLFRDSYAVNLTFEDWCSELGYDTDSRKALEMYLACQKEAGQLKQVMHTLNIDFDAATEAFQDY